LGVVLLLKTLKKRAKFGTLLDV